MFEKVIDMLFLTWNTKYTEWKAIPEIMQQENEMSGTATDTGSFKMESKKKLEMRAELNDIVDAVVVLRQSRGINR